MPTTLMRWNFTGYGEVSDQDPAFADCLLDLLALPRSDAAAARDFALRWGVLGVCWSSEHSDGYHARPATLMEIQHPLLLEKWRQQMGRMPRPPGPPRDDRVSGVAPLLWWHDVARRLEAAIRLNVDLEHGHAGGDEDWATLWGVSDGHPFGQGRSLADLRLDVAATVDRWWDSLHREYGPATVRRGERVQPVDPTGLDVAVLALADRAMEDGVRPLVCANPDCGRTFLMRTRRSRPGEIRFCDRHGKPERLRLSQRARRERMTDDERTKQRANDAERMRRRRAKPKGEPR